MCCNDYICRGDFDPRIDNVDPLPKPVEDKDGEECSSCNGIVEQFYLTIHGDPICLECLLD